MRAHHRAARALRQQGGATIIEMVVVIAIISIVGMIGVMIVTSTVNSQLRAAERLGEQQTAQTVLGWMNARLSTATKPVGVLHGTSGSTNPASVGPDQLVFTSGDGRCYRVVYLRAERQLRAMRDSSCSQAAMIPKRPPNTPVPFGDTCGSDRHAAPGSPYYDPMIDNIPSQPANCRTGASASWTLANHVLPAVDSSSNELPIFEFVDSTQRPVGQLDYTSANLVIYDSSSPPSPQKDAAASDPTRNYLPNTASWWYNGANRAQVDAVRVNFRVYERDPDRARTPGLHVQQTITLQSASYTIP